MHYLPILTTLISLIFTIAVFNRYLAKRRAHLLFWSIGLALYGIGALTEVIMLFSFNAVALKLWYLSGAMLTAAWLGQGTVNLLVRRRRLVRGLNIILVIASLIAFGLVIAAPVTSASGSYNPAQPLSAQYQDILVRSSSMVLMTILLNIYGTFTLVGGAIYSAYIFWRKRVLFNRMVGNILIAAGAMLPAIGGSFVRLNLPDFLYLSEFLGVILMYIGFIQATLPVPVDSPSPATTD